VLTLLDSLRSCTRGIEEERVETLCSNSDETSNSFSLLSLLPLILPLSSTSSIPHELNKMSSSNRPPLQLPSPPEETDSPSQPPLPSTTDPSSPTPTRVRPSTSRTSLFEWEVYRATHDHQTGRPSIQQSNNSERNEVDSVCEFASSSSS